MIKRSIFLGLLSATLACSTAQSGSPAPSHTFSAEFYLSGCKDFVAGRSNFFSGRCVGAIEVLDALNADTKLFCPPEGNDNQKRLRIVIEYIESHPQRAQEDFRLIANEAMARAWPCKK